MLRLKLEGKESNIIREFINLNPIEFDDKAYDEVKIIEDKNGNIINQKNINNNRSKYSHERYVWKLKQQGYNEIWKNI